MSSRLEQLKVLFDRIAACGDQLAFAELFRMEYKRLYAFAFQYIQQHEACEEVVNDVFLNLWKFRQTLTSINNPESYLFITVKNNALNYLKKYSRFHISLSEGRDLSELIKSSTVQYDVEWKELHYKLTQVIDELPDQCKKIFKLIKEEGFKPKQVAEILNISVRTVETQLYRAIKRLSLALSEELPKKRKGRDNLIALLFAVGSLAFLAL